MKDDSGCILGVATFIIILACVGLIFNPTANEVAAQANADMFPDSQNAAYTSSAAPMELPVMMPEAWSALVWIVSIGIFCFVLYVIAKNGGGPIMALFTIAVVFFGLLFWVLVLRGGDVSTPEARGDNLQVVEVIQPIGDPQADAMNADTNQTNAGANVVNAVSFSIYAAGGWVTVILIVFGGMFLLGALKAKTG